MVVVISVKAPGKLYIAGEYAVVEKGMPSIVVALNQFITVNINETNNVYGQINSKQYPNSIVKWNIINNKFQMISNNINDFEYVISAMKITFNYIRSLGYKLNCFDINIDSSLNSSDGKKYGLGSSAAVTVGIVKAILKYYDLNISLEKIFKLSSIAHLDVQGNGSLGDIAASVYGGWIAYSSFDRNWLKKHRNIEVEELINLIWPELRIEPLTPPANLELLIGWTGTPASTSSLVNKVEKNYDKKDYNTFLSDSKKCINRMISGFHKKSLRLIQKEILVNRLLLNKLGKFTGINIETPKLNKLCQIAIKNHGAAKSSGAGGGDCGIVIIDKKSSKNKIIDEWKDNDIQSLNLKIHKNL
ncbi:phosphomevalonate kinase [Apilactobacillus micheneri]|uniref:phosphomevalonate kinase n=1 Tax=Apilactobacillus micheneri TaxID=1899430 RepID=A0ABY2YXR2_9LACO|nr:phosphomevalonate kinase [Apilactobacillus micheneri]TPR26863.1 phosphomevalonate kinase [Apilactobacillus micheneri]TPR28651.1 phosphomevalonate kinase [Apilactobacillus micheneri]TPR29338.1 phosphomevalonate kinase [Apilactobacillus micheneri]TPR30926.1 phosphomevalonate kinase [Apilactobacillus micheneri]